MPPGAPFFAVMGIFKIRYMYIFIYSSHKPFSQIQYIIFRSLGMPPGAPFFAGMGGMNHAVSQVVSGVMSPGGQAPPLQSPTLSSVSQGQSKGQSEQKPRAWCIDGRWRMECGLKCRIGDALALVYAVSNR